MDERQRRMQDLGRKGLEAAVRGAMRNMPAALDRTVYTVDAVNSDGTCDVSRGSGDVATSLTGIPYTTACAGIAEGARVLVDTLGHISYVTGVLAGSVSSLGELLYENTSGSTDSVITLARDVSGFRYLDVWWGGVNAEHYKTYSRGLVTDGACRLSFTDGVYTASTHQLMYALYSAAGTTLTRTQSYYLNMFSASGSQGSRIYRVEGIR